LTYKSQRFGMKVEIQCEKYTSQTCPACCQRHKPKNRTYNALKKFSRISSCSGGIGQF
ncbi:zinc ribbon domain-containing protein, partial [Anabaena azotica]|uniref:zinc ribbon domain-containing protein n=1 Tax=Anabaena azotica TaxID=197653 RepID=UPI002410FC8F